MRHDGLVGENNWLWKGDEASYSALHQYLAKYFPKSGTCDKCGAERRTQYALIHGRSYSRNPDDYTELCSTCHMRYDQGGERNTQAKLTAEQVIDIRRRYRKGKSGGGPGTKRREGSVRFLAEEFGVSSTTIRHILAGRKWAVVPMESSQPATDA